MCFHFKKGISFLSVALLQNITTNAWTVTEGIQTFNLLLGQKIFKMYKVYEQLVTNIHKQPVNIYKDAHKF